MRNPLSSIQITPLQRSILALLLLFALPFLLFWQVWWPDAGQRHVFQYGDFVEHHYPMRVFVAGELQAGRLPMWDAYSFAGTSVVADSLFAVYYPLGLWQIVFPRPMPFLIFELEAIIHLGLAGLFTFLFVRRLTGRASAGLLAGVAFSLSGFLTSYPMLQLIILETAIWLPAGLWLLEIALSRKSLLRVAGAGVVLGLGVLAGHPQTFLYVAYVVAAYYFFRAWYLKLPIRLAVPAAFVLAGAVLGISAAQWLPGLEMHRLSPRAGLTYEEVSHGFAASELWGLLRPNPGEYSPLYVGLLPLLLAVSGLVILRRRVEIWFWVSLTVLALLLSLGRNGILYPLAYSIAPGFSVFRNQERAAFLVCFGLCVLAGYGYTALARQRWWPGALLPFALVITFLDLFLANNGIILQPPPADGYFSSTAAVQQLQLDRDPHWRVSSEGLLPGGGNAGLFYQIRDVVGNHPLHLAAVERFYEDIPEERWWQMLNVRYLLTQRALDHGALLSVLEETRSHEGDGTPVDIHMYQVFLGSQPAWVAREVALVASLDEALSVTAREDLDPHHTVVLEHVPIPYPEPAYEVDIITLLDFDIHHVSLSASLEIPGVLVLSEVWYPGWNVYVDGQRADSLRAYGLLRAVALPAGQSLVEWRFQPVLARLGQWVSLLTALVILAWALAPTLRGCLRSRLRQSGD